MYKNILAAIDLVEPSANLVLDTVQDIADPETHVTVLHVVEPQYVNYSFDPTFTGSLIRSLENSALESARERVAALIEPYEIDPDDQVVVIGHAASEIRKYASEHGSDLIVLGTHGRRGWQRILGNTATGVLHGAPVDVFMCRFPQEEN